MGAPTPPGAGDGTVVPTPVSPMKMGSYTGGTTPPRAA